LPPQSKIVTLHSMTPDKILWPHAPEHRLCVRGTYFVTASTHLRQHHFVGKARLAVLHRGLLKVAADFGWRLEAWAVFSNHYHFIGHSPADAATAENLSRMLGLLHEKTAKWINRLDDAPARKVWHNYRETADLRKIVSGAAELRSSKPRETRPRAGGKPVSVVLRPLVRAHRNARANQNHLPLQDRSNERAGQL